MPDGAVLVDPRPPHVFAATHRRGSLNVVGNDSFAVRAGAVIPLGTPIVLLTADSAQASALALQLATIGFDDVRGFADPVPEAADDLERTHVVNARDAKRLADGGAQLLDVRERSEYETAHARGALHIPYQQLEHRLDELPCGKDIVVYCTAGVRSSLAASVLERHGRSVIDLRGGFGAWVSADLPTEA